MGSGKILRLKTVSENKVQVTMFMSWKQFYCLKGCMENMHIFSEDNLEYSSKLVQRGRRESTKYFLLPKEFRKDIYPTSKVNSTKLETSDKHIFIFAVDKINL